MLEVVMKCFRGISLGVGLLALIVAGSAQAQTYVFLADDPAWSPPSDGLIRIMLVGGGAGGGGAIGSGGPGGEAVVYEEFGVYGAETYTVDVGAGGAGGVDLTNGDPGSESSFSGLGGTLTARGGNFGGGGNTVGGTSPDGVFVSGTPQNANPIYSAGGGAGLSGNGADGSIAGPPYSGGDGGLGLTITAVWGTFPVGTAPQDQIGGGGGGGTWNNGAANSDYTSSSGNYGGGDGAYPTTGATTQPTAGTANTGGGGGGGGGLIGGPVPERSGAAGGSGIVIIEFTAGSPNTIADALIHYTFESDAGDNIVNYGRLGDSMDGDPANQTIETGVIGNAIKFNPPGAHPSSNAGVFTRGTLNDSLRGAFTLACWISRPAGTVYGYEHIISLNYNNSGNLSTFPGGPDTFAQGYAGATYGVASLPVSAVVDDWHHLATTWDGTDQVLYYDGVAIQTDSHSVYGSTVANDVSFGCWARSAAYDYTWRGLMDDAYVFERALNATEIGLLYNIGAGPQPSMAVKGGASQDQTIAAGDASPTTAKGTDFGAVIRGDTSGANTFTITNELPAAAGDLTGLSVSLTGTDNSEFTVVAQPAASLIPGAATTFTVSFDPDFPGSGDGTKSATVNIANSGVSDPWTFDVTGVATNYPAPIMIASAEVAPGTGNTVGTLRALNDAQGVTYSKDGGDDEADFSISGDQLILDVAAALSDDPRYVNVKATSDWGTSDSMAIEVTVAAGGGAGTIFIFR
jgi:hypothetical protein